MEIITDTRYTREDCWRVRPFLRRTVFTYHMEKDLVKTRRMWQDVKNKIANNVVDYSDPNKGVHMKISELD